MTKKYLFQIILTFATGFYAIVILGKTGSLLAATAAVIHTLNAAYLGWLIKAEDAKPNAPVQPTAERSVAGRLEGVVGQENSDVC